MKFHSAGVQQFLRSRLVRIAIPVIVGWFVLRPMLVSVWIIGAESMRGEANVLEALKAGFVSLAELPKEFLVGTHLWFLYYLLLISISLLLVRYLVGLHKPMKTGLTRLADRISHWICHSRLSIFVVAIPTAGCLWFMNHWGMDTPDKSLVPHPPVLLVYGGFFLFGWLIHRQGPLMEQFARITWVKLVLCILATMTTLFLSSFEMNAAHSQYVLIRIGFTFSYAVMMWSLVSLVIGLFQRTLDRPSKIVRYIADSSYWLYLIHLPIVIGLQIAFAEFSFHWSIKWVSISVLTIFLAILLYELFVRSTIIGATLNGKRKPRIFSWSGR
jgi:peptidoglycan/LPS O-acetylase OafA/YrhL